jgi:hypothetical protein
MPVRFPLRFAHRCERAVRTANAPSGVAVQQHDVVLMRMPGDGESWNPADSFFTAKEHPAPNERHRATPQKKLLDLASLENDWRFRSRHQQLPYPIASQSSFVIKMASPSGEPATAGCALEKPHFS